MYVAIPTKGRPSTTTYKLLGDIPFTHFVEPQDMAAYQAAGVPNLQEISDNDKGITFVRNYILDWGHVQGHKWLWIMDDDVNGFGVAKAGKTIKGDHNVLTQFHKAVEQFKFPVNGLNYCQYAWSYSTKKQASPSTNVHLRYAHCCISQRSVGVIALTGRKTETSPCWPSNIQMASSLIFTLGSTALASAPMQVACSTSISKNVMRSGRNVLSTIGRHLPNSSRRRIA